MDVPRTLTSTFGPKKPQSVQTCSLGDPPDSSTLDLFKLFHLGIPSSAPRPVLSCSLVAHLYICKQVVGLRLKKGLLVTAENACVCRNHRSIKNRNMDFTRKLRLTCFCCCMNALSRKCDQTVDYMRCYSFHPPPICEINKCHYHNKSFPFTFHL